MRSGKKIIGIIVVLVILLMIAGGTLAYFYFATDIFKTDRELFFKYFSQITQENGFIDGRIKEYNEKKNKSPYENSGEITVSAEVPEETINNNVIQKVNELSIDFSGKTDIANQKVEKSINIDYGNNVKFPIQYIQDGDKFGLKFDKISGKFISIRNENLEELIEKITGISINTEDIAEITESLKSMNIKFTENEKNQLKEIYTTVLSEQLLPENFSKVKTEQNESYILDLSNEQLKNIIIKMLETTKQNTLIIDKVNEIILANDSEAQTIETSEIDELIESVNNEDISNVPNIKMTLVQDNGILKQIILETGDNKISIIKNSSDDSLSYDINCKVDMTTFSEDETEQQQSNSYFNLQYTGLKDLNNVTENYEIGYDINTENQFIKYDYQISSNVQFEDMVSIEDINSDVAVFLNDYDADVLQNFLVQVGTRLLQVNKNQMDELGLKEYENPLIYSTPLITLGLQMYNNTSGTVEDSTNLNEYVIQEQENSQYMINDN